MTIKIVNQNITLDEIKQMAKESFGEMIKAVIDVEKGILALGGDLHADAENLLLSQNCQQKDLWGINLYPFKEKAAMIEFSSLINIRPKLGNRTMIIEIFEIKEKITGLINQLII